MYIYILLEFIYAGCETSLISPYCLSTYLKIIYYPYKELFKCVEGTLIRHSITQQLRSQQEGWTRWTINCHCFPDF